MNSFFKKIRPILQIAITVLVFYFIFQLFRDNWQELKDFDWQINYLFLLLTLVFYTLSFFILGLSARKVTEYITDRKLELKKVVRIFFTAQIIRYIPGNIWSFISLGLQNEEKLGIRKSHTALAIVVEITLRLAVGAILSIVFLAEVFQKYSYFYYIVLALAVLVIAFILYNPKLLNKILNFLLRKKGENFVIEKTFDYKKISVLLLLLTLHWLGFGAGLYFLIKSLGIEGISIFTAIGINMVAWMVGYLSLLTPSGIGIREGAIIVLLTPVIGIALAGAVSVLARIVFIVSELLNLALVLIWTKDEEKPS